MAKKVRIEIVAGPHRGRVFNFPERVRCTIGRASDCYLRLYGDDRDEVISRHHCIFTIDQDEVKLTDLGSLNGTKVNGVLVQPLPDIENLTTECRQSHKTIQLHHLDLIEIGETVMQLTVYHSGWDHQLLRQERHLWQSSSI